MVNKCWFYNDNSNMFKDITFLLQSILLCHDVIAYHPVVKTFHYTDGETYIADLVLAWLPG